MGWKVVLLCSWHSLSWVIREGTLEEVAFKL